MGEEGYSGGCSYICVCWREDMDKGQRRKEKSKSFVGIDDHISCSLHSVSHIQ